MLLRKPQNYEQMVNRGRHGENLVPVFPCDWPGRDLLVLEYCTVRCRIRCLRLIFPLGFRQIGLSSLSNRGASAPAANPDSTAEGPSSGCEQGSECSDRCS